jgi:GntR family transcriptional regulator
VKQNTRTVASATAAGSTEQIAPAPQVGSRGLTGQDVEDRAKFSGLQRPAILAEQLRERLLGQEWLAGEQLPSEAALAAHYGVSRVTVRTALSSLEKAGFIRIRHGKGSFVTHLLPSIRASLHELRSMSATIANAGREPGVVYRQRLLRLPTAEECKRLQISTTNPVLYLERAILADSEVVAFDYDIINVALLPNDFDPNVLTGSVFEYLQTINLVPEQAVTEVRPVLAADIGWGKGRSPIGLYLLLDQLQFLRDDQILSWSLIYFVEDRFQFTILRRS